MKFRLLRDAIFIEVYHRLKVPILLFIALISSSTLVYWYITEYTNSLFDCFYMTMITVTTIGYGEVINMGNQPEARFFTVFVAISGIILATYTFTSVVAIMVEGRINKRYKYLTLMNAVNDLKNHYIICGAGRIGTGIANEMLHTRRPFVIIERDASRVSDMATAHPHWLIIEGEAADDDTLQKAGINRCAGVFAATNDDNTNLVISLSAKQLNEEARVVSMCKDMSYITKITKAGADKVISPYQIGGLRMASEMLRPTVTSFLDDMLRDSERNYRFEEFTVPQRFIGSSISDLDLGRFENSNFLAVRKRSGDAIYRPQNSYIFTQGDVLIVITNPQEREQIEQLFL